MGPLGLPPRRSDRAPLLEIGIDPRAGAPLHRQLYDALRRAILAGRLPAGARLPSSRALAQEHGLSRNTVLAALDQLASEGYVEGRSGSGTYVAPELPDRRPDGTAGAAALAAGRGKDSRPGPSARGRSLSVRRGRMRPGAAMAGDSAALPFAPGVPELAAFPFELWARLLARHWRHPPAALALGGDAAGHAPLRAAIADHIRRVRAVDCAADQVIVVSGIRQAVDLAVRLLLDPGDPVWMEEPGFPGIRAVLTAADLEVVPVPVDGEGLDVAAGTRAAPQARLACVAPSHQYPLGVVMSLARRLELLAWARGTGAWIIEDDYDSEYRYSGRPLAAMQGLDRDGRVIYVGSFSKVLFPSLRLGYLVVPPALVDAFLAARATLDDHAPMTPQPALADFIAEGHFAAHLRRMRRLYAARQRALIDAAARHLAELLEVAPDEVGMHLVAGLAPALAVRMDDTTAAARAAAAGIACLPLSGFYAGTPRRQGVQRQGLLLGYAAFDEAAIDDAARRLAAALAR